MTSCAPRAYPLVIFSFAVVCAGCQYKHAISDRYAIQQVADMLVITMKKNDCDNIANWKELRPSFDVTQPGYNNFTFDELQSRIQINFPVTVAVAKERPAKAFVRLKRTMREAELSPMELAENEGIIKAIDRICRGTYRAP